MSTTTWIAGFAVFLLGTFHISLAYAFRRVFHLLLGVGWFSNIIYLYLEHVELHAPHYGISSMLAGFSLLVFFVSGTARLTKRPKRYLAYHLPIVAAIGGLFFLPTLFSTGLLVSSLQFRATGLALVSCYVFFMLGVSLLQLPRSQLTALFGSAIQQNRGVNVGRLPSYPDFRNEELSRIPEFMADQVVLRMDHEASRGATLGKNIAGVFFCFFGALQLAYPFKELIVPAAPAAWRGLFVAGMVLKLGTGVGFVVLLRAFFTAREAQVRRSEMMEGLAVIMAAVQHDMAQPLSLIGGLIANLRRFSGDLLSHQGQRLREYTDHLAQARGRIEAVMDLIVAMRETPNQFEEKTSQISIDQVLKKSTENIKTFHKAHAPVIKTTGWRSSIVVLGDLRRLIQVMTNLMNNAIEAHLRHKPGTHPVLYLASRVDAGEGEVIVSITDEGGGIPEHIFPYVKSAFISTKSPQEKRNSGVGLYIADRLLFLHRGRLELVNTPGRGVTANMVLPWSQKIR